MSSMQWPSVNATPSHLKSALSDPQHSPSRTAASSRRRIGPTDLLMEEEERDALQRA